MSTYASFGAFGSSKNRNIQDPYDPANPLTYSVIPSFNTIFLHGATGDSALLNRVYAPNCQAFMAEYGSLRPGDDFVRAYMAMNQDTYWPNTAVIDRMSMATCYESFNVHPNLGEMMMHNACERRFLEWPSVSYYFQPFDPTVANSPMVKFYAQPGVTGRPVIRNLSSRVQMLNDWWIQQMIERPLPVLDIWVRFYVAWKRGEWKGIIESTPMEAFLMEKSNRFQYLFNVLSTKQPGYDTVQWLPSTNNYLCEETDYIPETQSLADL